MRLTGRGVSPGVAVGRALVLTHRALDVRYRVTADEVDREVERLARAIATARRQLGEIRERLGRGDDPEPASIFDAQLLMLDDPLLTGRAADLIRAERVNAEWALRRAGDELIAAFDRAADAYLRERKGDIAARASAAAIDEFRRLPAVTPDGVRVTLEANSEVADEAADARAHGAQGVGLCLSEFLLGVAPGAAGEEAQCVAYRRIIEAMAPSPVTIRTFDVVEDDREPRGRAGLRGLRLGLARRETFRVQLRALLRAARHGRLRILFRFVTGVDELREARRVVAEVAADLAGGGEAPPPVPVGAMTLVPTARKSASVASRSATRAAAGTSIMRTGAIPLVTQVLRATPAADARRLAACALRAATAEDVERDVAAELEDERRA